jgi:hypothetical protein
MLGKHERRWTMKTSTLALVLGSAITIAGSGLAVTACSSSSSPEKNPGNDASSGGDTGSSSGGSGSSSGSSGSSSGAAVDCGTTPAIHQDEAGTIYCGFGAGDAGELYCPTGQECCVGGGEGQDMFAPQVCQNFATTCTNGGGPDAGTNEQPIPIQCAQVTDCTTNGVTSATACCLQGAKSSTVAGCGYPKYSDGTAIICEGDAGGSTATACAAGEVQVCSSQADCPANTTCTAGKWKILQLGFCM